MTKEHKKELRNRLSAINTIYMDDLEGKKKKKFKKHLDSKLKDIVNYYTSLLKKKNRKKSPSSDELKVDTAVSDETGKAAINNLNLEKNIDSAASTVAPSNIPNVSSTKVGVEHFNNFQEPTLKLEDKSTTV